MIEIDHAKCNQDYICSDECAYGFMYEKNEDGYPVISPAMFEKYCIQCGHCIAICPTGAISYSGVKQDRLEKLKKEDRLSHDQAVGFLRSRRSLRTFKKEPVPQALLFNWLDVTRWAPTGSNSQQVNWVLVHDAKKVAHLAGLIVDWLKKSDASPEIVEQWHQGHDIVLRHAPHLLIATLPQNYFWAQTDAATAIAYLELSAHSLGLGTCWAGYFTRAASEYAPLQKVLNLPVDHKVAGAVMVGFPVYRFTKVPQRNKLSIHCL
jgi:nitroreductase/NAD-dependent dihydropyrimidine dehydrogenase PreA subunit